MNGKSYLNNKNKLGSFKNPQVPFWKTGHIPGQNGGQRKGGLKEPNIDLQAVNLTKDDHSFLYLAKDWEWKPKKLTTS